MNPKRFLAAAVLTLSALSAFALPTVDEVQVEIGRGNYARAETMMQEVVVAKPGSARAHYLYAEILAHNQRFGEASAQLARARDIDPAIKFTDAAKFNAFAALLERQQLAAKSSVSNSNSTSSSTAVAPMRVQQQRPAAVAPEPAGTPSWVWALGLGGVAAAVFFWTQRRKAASAPMGMGTGMANGMATSAAGAGPGNAMGFPQQGYGPNHGPNGPAAGGIGMMGVGLAAAGGVAAGMLASKMMGGDSHSSAQNTAAPAAAGGLTPGLFDDAQPGNPAARELEQRPIDFGAGENWGGGGDGASSDGGGGDGGGDGGGW